MSIKSYRFVSPGVFFKEVDASTLVDSRPNRGPVVIGRFDSGPAMRPYVVSSYDEFVRTYGTPHPGGAGADAWRGAPHGAPTYAAYAAEAWLNAQVAPVTVVRLLGEEHDNKSTTGQAGWDTQGIGSAYSAAGGHATTVAANAGAYGLFVINSGSQTSHHTGSLAAVWYLSEGSIELSGSLRGSTTDTSVVNRSTSGSAALFHSLDKVQASAGTAEANPYTFRAIIKDSSGVVKKTAIFDFEESSPYYIRKQFNTDPTRVNSNIFATADQKTYWLGETFDLELKRGTSNNPTSVTGSDARGHFGAILGLGNSNAEWQIHRRSWRNPKTGWFISQDTGNPEDCELQSTTQTLFRLCGLDHGEWLQNNMRVSIENVTGSADLNYEYGSFDVVVRKIDGRDNPSSIVETFTKVNLDPRSEDYIARRIGDRYLSWDYGDNRHRWYGNYDNKSQYIRVDMDSNVDERSTAAGLLPFGVYGPPRFKGFAITSGSTAMQAFGTTTTNGSAFAAAFAEGSGSIPNMALGANVAGHNSAANSAAFMLGGHNDPAASGPEVNVGCYGHCGPALNIAAGSAYTGSFRFPQLTLVSTASIYNRRFPDLAGAQWSTSLNGKRADKSIPDVLRSLPSFYNPHPGQGSSLHSDLEYSWVFSLDDLVLEQDTDQPKAYHVSGSRQSTTAPSYTAASGSYAILDKDSGGGYDSFTTFFYGGFDGLDIREREPFRNTRLDDSTNPLDNYAYNTVKRAIDMVADPEYVECNLMTMPGLTENTLTEYMIDICEDRADALAIIDLDGGYVPKSETTDSESTRRGSVATVVSNLRARALNSSYGCCYYPWVQVRAAADRTGGEVWVPPSVVALGTMASSEEKSSGVWFAPAGFNRGGLNNQGSEPGAAGITVLNVRERLSTSDRDKLYEQGINPIAKFPAEGIVVFGQKTLQQTKSALDRINVRRLLIYVKKEISIMASQVLFDQNVQVTWDRFTSMVNPFLANVKSQFGLTGYKLVLDETTTTDDLIDRNIMYAKIFLKPARAIEYIALDFIVTRSGASFED